VEKISESPDKRIVRIKSGDGSYRDVESTYLFPVLCSPRDFNRIEILVEKEVNTRIVLISSRANLENTLVEKYVLHGERTQYAMGKGKTCIPAKTSTCRGRRKWYALESSASIEPARIFFVKSWDKKVPALFIRLSSLCQSEVLLHLSTLCWQRKLLLD